MLKSFCEEMLITSFLIISAIVEMKTIVPNLV